MTYLGATLSLIYIFLGLEAPTKVEVTIVGKQQI